MARQREPRLAADPATRGAILITLLALVAGGAFAAWAALRPAAAPLPSDALARIAAAAAGAAGPQAPGVLCAPAVDLVVGHFISAGAPAAAAGLARAVAAAAAALGPLLPPLRVDYASVYVDTAVLVQEAKQCPPGAADCAAVALGPAAARRLGWRLHSELPAGVGGIQMILVLEGTNGTTPLKVELAPEVALVVTAGGASAAATANEIAGWMAVGVPQGVGEAAAARTLRGACLQKAAAAMAAAVAELAVGAQAGVVVTPGLAQAAEDAVEAYEVAAGGGGTWQEGLARARGAAAAAAELAAHPDLATPPQLPPEHALTMLLPITLPVCLAVGQAVGREAQAARRRRRAIAAADSHLKAG